MKKILLLILLCSCIPEYRNETFNVISYISVNDEKFKVWSKADIEYSIFSILNRSDYIELHDIVDYFEPINTEDTIRNKIYEYNYYNVYTIDTLDIKQDIKRELNNQFYLEKYQAYISDVKITKIKKWK